MNRRDTVLALIALGAASGPLTSFAQQQGKVWRIGFLGLASATSYAGRVDALRAGLRDLGYFEGKNLLIESRFSDGKAERLPGLALELVRMKVDVIVTGDTPATAASQKETATIPIVFGTAGEPVSSGFVKSLARPGSNITGLSTLTDELGSKHLEILLTMVPKLAHVAFYMNPASALHPTILKNIRSAALRTSVKILPVEAQTPQQIENTFSTIVSNGAKAVIVPPDGFFVQQFHQIAELAAKHRLPSAAPFREYVEVGGLISYGPNFADLYRRAAIYVDKIFKGATPGDLPVEQPTKFELFINGKTAKALGITIPQSLLVRADEVIQ